MTFYRLACVTLALACCAGDAQAQNLFEMLFGPPPSRRGPPPGSVPPGNVGRPPPGSIDPRSAYPPPPEADVLGGPRQSLPPVAAKPVLLAVPSDDSVVGRDLKLNGTSGTIRIERGAAGAMRATITLAGTKISNAAEACAIQPGGGQPVPLISEGRPDNTARFRTDAPLCPITFEVVDGAVLVDPKTPVCEIAESDCRVEPGGMWGPDAASLLPRAKDFDQQRGVADKAVRDNYKTLAMRAGPQGVRPVVAEQAAFSADREQTCKSYAREGTHGFCNARFTEARALALAGRLGMNVAVAPSGNQPRAARRRSPIADLPEDQ